MTNKEQKKVLEAHKHWVLRDVDGWETMRANLRDANLRGANLWCADLQRANLRDANLRDADLRGANLWGANLLGANLRGANLWGANLLGANLQGANLLGANLLGANLLGANLLGANLQGANLWGANLRSAKNLQFIPLVCPGEGSFVAYKKADGLIVKLLIPDDARRSSATSRKCRASKAIVLEIQKIDGALASVTEVSSNWNREFVYRVGETVEVKDFDENRWNECSTGIHFFMNRQEAVKY